MTSDVDVKFVRYNGSPMRDLIAFGSKVRLANQGVIFEVTPDILHKVQRYLHGSDSERSYFQPVSAEYAATLRRCTSCNVYFEDPSHEQRHLSLHEQAKRNSDELRQLAALELEDAKDAEVIKQARERIQSSKVRRATLLEVMDGKGLEAAIVG